MGTKLLAVVGDLHFRPLEPYLSSKMDFLDWLIKHPINSKENAVIFEGDVGNEPKLPGHVVGYIIWAFERLKFSNIYILAGNHDWRKREGNLLDALRNVKNVVIIDYPIQVTLNTDYHIMMLPHFLRAKGSNIPAMKIFYEDITKQGFKDEYDLIVGHVADETQNIFGKGIDLSYLKGRKIFGHIHIPGPHYVGTPVITRKDEKGKESVIIAINLETKAEEKIVVPKFLDFLDANWSDLTERMIQKVGADYVLVSLYGAPDEESARKKVTEAGGNLHRHYLEEFQEKPGDAETNVTGYESESLAELFEGFCKSKAIPKKVVEKLSYHLGDKVV